MAGVAAALLAACGQAGAVGSTQRSASDTLRFPIGTDFGTLDPAYLDTQTDAEIAQNLFDGLVEQADDLRVVPVIASALPSVSPDGLTYTFRLRHDVVFWNGDTVTAKDVLYSWNRAAALQGPYSTSLAAIAGFDKLAPKPPPPAALEQLLERRDSSVTLSGLSAPDGLDGYTAFVRVLADLSVHFGKPVLLINGDSHLYGTDQPLADPHGATGLIHNTQSVANLTRITVQGSTSKPREWLRLTIDPRSPRVFSWENVVYGDDTTCPQ